MGLFKKIFGKKGFFDKIGRGIDKATGGISSKLLNGVKKVAYSVPVVGPIAKVAVEDIGGTIVGNISKAAVRDGIVKAEKIADTVLKSTASTINDKETAKAVGNAIAHGVQREIKNQTGLDLPIQAAAHSAGTNLTPYTPTLLDKVKAKARQAWEFVKTHWIWFTGAFVLVGLFFIIKPLFGRKKWRI